MLVLGKPVARCRSESRWSTQMQQHRKEIIGIHCIDDMVAAVEEEGRTCVALVATEFEWKEKQAWQGLLFSLSVPVGKRRPNQTQREKSKESGKEEFAVYLSLPLALDEVSRKGCGQYLGLKRFLMIRR